jgi:hypothetical protein
MKAIVGAITSIVLMVAAHSEEFTMMEFTMSPQQYKACQEKIKGNDFPPGFCGNPPKGKPIKVSDPRKALATCYAEVLKDNSDYQMVRDRVLTDCMARHGLAFKLNDNSCVTPDTQYLPACWDSE